MKIKIINGANLNMLGKREAIYGSMTLAQMNEELKCYAALLGAELVFFQSNCEGAIIDEIHLAIEGFDGLIINPGAYTHYSYSIMDALKILKIPKIEVHLTDIKSREPFRATSVTAMAVDQVLCGEGILSYKKAIDIIVAQKG